MVSQWSGGGGVGDGQGLTLVLGSQWTAKMFSDLQCTGTPQIRANIMHNVLVNKVKM